MSEQSTMPGPNDRTPKQLRAERQWERDHDVWTSGGQHGPAPEYPHSEDEIVDADPELGIGAIPEATEAVASDVPEADDTPIGPPSPSEEEKARVRSMIEYTRRRLRDRDGAPTQPPVDGPDDAISAK